MKIIYVDDEQPAIDNFRLTVEHFPEIKSLTTFLSGEEALQFVKEHPVDAAFLDMEMPGIHGIDLAKAIKAENSDIRIVFVTAYGQYALDAWSVDATGYLLKPYTAADIRKGLNKCRYRLLPMQRVNISTMPSLSVTVNGVPLQLHGAKTREMLALLVDRGERGFSVGEGIACLWPERENDGSTASLFRMTFKRLSAALEEAGVGDILETRRDHRRIKVDEVDCDLYRILSGDKRASKLYSGQYLSEYSWAEERNAQLYWMLMGQ